MADQVIPPIESHDTTRTVIVDAYGQTYTIGGIDERTLLTPDGGRTYTTTTIRTLTRDGVILDPERGDTGHVCPVCTLGLFSQYAMTTCQVCQRSICRTCAVPLPEGMLCTPCHDEHRRRTRWKRLFSIA